VTLNIDLTDPHVRQMLGGGEVASGKRVVQLAGDDPTGRTNQRGMSSTTYLEHGKHEVVVVYKDTFLTVDVYLVPGTPPEIHLICPRCHKASRISGDHKAIDFDPRAVNPMWMAATAAHHRDLAAIAGVGRLSVEPFECTWEIGGDRHVAGGVHTGVTLCRQKLVIDNNRAKDA
jgi:hypothetical protein